MNKTKYTAIVLVALTLSGLLAAIHTTGAYTPRKIAEVMSSPLPTVPAAVLRGEDFPVTVKDLSTSTAGETSSWAGVITSIYGAYEIELVDADYVDEVWHLSFNVPPETRTGLYNLTLIQTKGSATTDIHQSRCVWVLDEWPESVTLAQITDIHESNIIGEKVFPSFIMQSNFMNPDIMIATGDIVDTEFVSRGWEYLQYSLNQLEYPSYMLPGNHDYSGYGGKAYAVYCGTLNYTVVLGDFLFVALDTGENGYLKDDQVAWFGRQLEKYRDKIKIIGFHHAFLSSEYEDDMGTLTGGYIEADWENIDDLADTMYFTWLDTQGNPLEVSKTMLRLIQEYDVRVILDGHVHRDMIYVVNNRHYFVTTSTCGGGLTPGNRFGSRLITIDSDGTVHLDKYASENLDNPPNNIPTGYLNYTYRSANDFTGTAVTVRLENALDMDVAEGRLIFKVSKSKPLGSYVWVGEQPVRVETTTTEKGYVFDAYFNSEAHSSFEVTLKAEDDSTDPEITVSLESPYQSETPTTVTLTASDYGWGLKEVDISYSTDDGATWVDIDSRIKPILLGNKYMDTYPEYNVVFEVPAMSGEESLIVKAEASDYAGNAASYQSPDLTLGEPVTYTLSVTTEPVDVDITVNGGSETTPYEASLMSGTVTLSAPSTVSEGGDDYEFKEWSTGSTSTEITVELTEDTSVSVTYEMVETTEPVEEPAAEGGGIPFPAQFMVIGVAVSSLYLWSRKTRLS